MDTFFAARAAGRIPENQRLYRDGNGTRGHTHSAQVHVIEVPQRQAVDDHDFRGDLQFFAQHRTKIQSDVGIEDHVDRFTLVNAVGHRSPDALRERFDPSKLGFSLPVKGEDDVGVRTVEIEHLQLPVDRLDQAIDVKVLRKMEIGANDLNVAPRKQRLRVTDVPGVTAQLGGELRAAERSRANALTLRQQPPGQFARIDTLAQRFAEPRSQVTEITVLAAIKELRNAAGENDTVYTLQFSLVSARFKPEPNNSRPIPRGGCRSALCVVTKT